MPLPRSRHELFTEPPRRPDGPCTSGGYIQGVRVAALSGFDGHARVERLGEVAVLGLWVALVAPTAAWLAVRLTAAEGTWKLAALLVPLAVVVRRAAQEPPPCGFARPSASAWPVLRARPAAAGVLVGAACAIVATRGLAVHHLSALLAAVGTWGWVGLYLPASSFRRGLVPLCLAALVLPLSAQLDVYAGFPARLAAAEMAQGLLSALGAPDVSRETILSLDGTAAQVDGPCSGMRGLWAGAVLSLVLTWIDRRPVGARWLGVNLAYAIALLAGNGLRVSALVGLRLVCGLPGLADLLHLPLGVLVFVASSSLLWLGLRGLAPAPARAEDAPPAGSSARILGGIVAALVVLQLAPAPAVRTSRSVREAALPAELGATPVALTRAERRFFEAQGALAVGKGRFDWRGQKGSLLVVVADTFRAHHPPEQCLQGVGLSVGDARTWLVTPTMPVRVLHLTDRPGSAVYWFQSRTRVTEDFAARVWSWSDARWVMVSILLDGSDPTPADLALLLRRFVARSVFGGPP